MRRLYHFRQVIGYFFVSKVRAFLTLMRFFIVHVCLAVRTIFYLLDVSGCLEDAEDAGDPDELFTNFSKVSRLMVPSFE